MAEETAPQAIEASSAPQSRPGRGYPEPFATRVAGRVRRPLGDLFGLTNFGVNLTQLPPGGVSALRHTHTREDEFIYIVEGEPILVTNAGETQLRPGMCAGFKAGSGNAHHLLNRTARAVVYLEIGDRNPGDTVVYPDDDIGRALSPDGTRLFVHRDGRPY
ncbi:MAG TPA: cupin domain-containing protein [Stellaceae bacterium]|nr:cupin domain-containing protein [Stellaceae bacterium]